MRVFTLFLIILALLGWAGWQAFYSKPNGHPYFGGRDPEGGNLVPYIGDTSICKEKSGRTINRVVENVRGFADLTVDRGCDISSCKIRLRRDGYNFIETELSEKQAERLRREVRLNGRQDLEYSAIATEAGWYRFEQVDAGTPGTENYELFKKRACEYRRKTEKSTGKESEQCGADRPDQIYIAMIPLSAPTARYHFRKFIEEEFIIPRRYRLTDYSVKVRIEAIEIQDTETNDTIAIDRQVITRFVNPRLFPTNYLACDHRNINLGYDVAEILVPSTPSE